MIKLKNMSKHDSYTLKDYIDPSIEIGNIVKLTDGSSLSLKENSKKKLFIVHSYPEITGSNKLIKDMQGIVIEKNITDKGVTFETGMNYIVYKQDILVQIGRAKFRIASKHVTKIM